MHASHPHPWCFPASAQGETRFLLLHTGSVVEGDGWARCCDLACRILGTLGIHIAKGDFSKSWSPTEGQDLVPGKTDALGCPLLLEV